MYVNDRPVATTATTDGATQINIPACDGDVIRIQGYDAAETLVAASQQEV